MFIIKILVGIIAAIGSLALCLVLKAIGILLFVISVVFRVASFLIGGIGKFAGGLAMLVIVGSWVLTGFDSAMIIYFAAAFVVATSQLWLEALANVFSSASAAL